MKKLGNKGFTLVEMAVAFAILAIVMLIVTLVITTSSNTYSRIATDINLQYESQMAMSQLQEYVIDCNAYIAVSSGVNNSLYIVNKTDDADYMIYKFAKKPDAEVLNFYKKTTTDPNDFIFTDDGELMSSYVTSFSAAVSTTSATITINYESGSKTYVGKQTIALRNKIEVVSSSVPQ